MSVRLQNKSKQFQISLLSPKLPISCLFWAWCGLKCRQLWVYIQSEMRTGHIDNKQQILDLVFPSNFIVAGVKRSKIIWNVIFFLILLIYILNGRFVVITLVKMVNLGVMAVSIQNSQHQSLIYSQYRLLWHNCNQRITICITNIAYFVIVKSNVNIQQICIRHKEAVIIKLLLLLTLITKLRVPFFFNIIIHVFTVFLDVMKNFSC